MSLFYLTGVEMNKCRLISVLIMVSRTKKIELYYYEWIDGYYWTHAVLEPTLNVYEIDQRWLIPSSRIDEIFQRKLDHQDIAVENFVRRLMTSHLVAMLYKSGVDAVAIWCWNQTLDMRMSYEYGEIDEVVAAGLEEMSHEDEFDNTQVQNFPHVQAKKNLYFGRNRKILILLPKLCYDSWLCKSNVTSCISEVFLTAK